MIDAAAPPRPVVRRRTVTADDVLADRGSRPFHRIVDRHPEAFRALLGVLNEPGAEEMLRRRSRKEPALAAVVDDLEDDDRITAVLDDPDDGDAFRRVVGLAVKAKMLRLGWAQAHRPRSMGRYTDRFRTAETYVPPDTSDLPPGHPLRVIEALEMCARIGTEEEQRRDVAEIRAAIARTRFGEGRPSRCS